MTLQEVSQKLGKSEATIYKNFKRTQETLAKKGIILKREGKGETVSYSIEYENKEN
jgi:predicted transcriptional regulator